MAVMSLTPGRSTCEYASEAIDFAFKLDENSVATPQTQYPMNLEVNSVPPSPMAPSSLTFPPLRGTGIAAMHVAVPVAGDEGR
jgi:hypothetical protein